ncbi:MAG: hypothetical protein OIN87_08270 [Candidatus Methanoperedens sp.]|nr:hypothetical protein [Candidatus Methanoperedens sp.]
MKKIYPILKKKCYALADRCETKWPDCGEKIELCNKEKIKELFQETRNKLENIWEEKEKQNKALETENK